MKDEIIYLISFVIASLPFVYSVYFCLTPKIKSFFGAGLMLVVMVAILELKLVSERIFGMSYPITVAFFILYYLAIFIFTKDSWKVVLKLYFMILAAITLSEIFFEFLFYLTGNTLENVMTPITRLIASFPMVVFIMAANLLWQKIYKISRSTKSVQFFAVFLSQLLICSISVFYILYNENSPIKLTTVILFTGAAWIITDLFFIKAVFDNHRKAQLQMSLDQAMEMEKMQYEYYENLTESINSLRKYRHDLNNILQTLMMIINNPETLENGKELLEQLCERYDETQLPYYCSNPVINAVILAKTATAEEKGISVDVSVDLENTQMFENIDLCSIFANMLDNALEAASEVENGRIAISSWADTGYLFIKCVNSYKGEVRKNGKGFVSTKGKDRGLGVSIIESITKKYGGSFFAEGKEEFSALAVLDLKGGKKS